MRNIQQLKEYSNEFFENEEIMHCYLLPGRRFRMKSLDKRIISNDGYISIGTNKYSVPIKYATAIAISDCLWV